MYLLKERFRCLGKGGLRLRDPRECVIAIKACIIMHNIALAYDPLDSESIDNMVNDHTWFPPGADIGPDVVDNNLNDNNLRRNQLIASFPNN